MDIHLVKKYFNPASILDIGGHTGEFFNLCINNFSLNYYFLIEGNDNCHEDIKKLNIPVTLFIYPESISSGKNFLSWDQLKELKNKPLSSYKHFINFSARKNRQGVLS